MNQPIASVTCRGVCGAEVWRGGHMSIADTEPQGVPFGQIEAPDGSVVEVGDAQGLLTEWADRHCVRTDCPHTTAALVAARDDEPLTISRGELEKLLTRVAKLEKKGTR